MCLWAIWMSALEKCLLMSYAHCFTVLHFPGVTWVSSLYILYSNPLSNMSFAKIFIPFIGGLLILLIVSFSVQKIFILTRSWSFIFAFHSLVFWDMPRKKLLQLRSKGFFPLFSSSVLMVSCVTFKSFIHFAFIFVHVVRKSSSLFLIMLLFSSPSTLCKETVFNPLDCLSSFVKD